MCPPYAQHLLLLLHMLLHHLLLALHLVLPLLHLVLPPLLLLLVNLQMVLRMLQHEMVLQPLLLRLFLRGEGPLPPSPRRMARSIISLRWMSVPLMLILVPLRLI